MAYIVADPCVKCKHTDCVAVCPVDCFYEGENMLVIKPEECIDCGACEPECPVNAIFEESDLPDKWQMYIGINAVFSGEADLDDTDTSGWPEGLADGARRHVSVDNGWPRLTQQKDALPGAEEAANEEEKWNAISPEPGAGDQ